MGQRLPVRGEGQQYTVEVAQQSPGAAKSERAVRSLRLLTNASALMGATGQRVSMGRAAAA